MQSSKDETHPADAIVVFGAAEYAGHPSPVFRARLDHAFVLFQKGVAPLVITTGGRGGELDLSEGGVGRDYLVARGIPEKNIIAETQSQDTSQSAERVGNIMKANGLHTCVAVSDGSHIFRIKRMFSREGIAAFGAPRPEYRVIARRQQFQLTMHEVLGYIFWKLHLDRHVSA
ncbi:MAG TPA: YdcF family protein [Terriglobales bacterium]